MCISKGISIKGRGKGVSEKAKAITRKNTAIHNF
jgi:hypothetical protein